MNKMEKYENLTDLIEIKASARQVELSIKGQHTWEGATITLGTARVDELIAMLRAAREASTAMLNAELEAIVRTKEAEKAEAAS